MALITKVSPLDVFGSCGLMAVGVLGMLLSIASTQTDAGGILSILSGGMVGGGLGWYLYRVRRF